VIALLMSSSAQSLVLKQFLNQLLYLIIKVFMKEFSSRDNVFWRKVWYSKICLCYLFQGLDSYIFHFILIWTKLLRFSIISGWKIKARLTEFLKNIKKIQSIWNFLWYIITYWQLKLCPKPWISIPITNRASPQFDWIYINVRDY
jgi:hypothetical protein